MDRRGVLVFGLVLCLLSAGCLELEGQNQEQQELPIGEICENITVSQSFVSTEDGLSRIDIMLATYARENTEDIIFELWEADTRELITTYSVNAQSIRDNAYHSFRFDPITNSAGRSYIFTLSSPRSFPGNAITAWCHPDDVYDGGTAIINNVAIEGDLRFRVYHTYSPTELAVFIFKRISQDKIFFVFWCLLLIVTAAGILRLHRKKCNQSVKQ